MSASAIPPVSVASLPWVNVLDYGAVGNDTADCTAAFNAAIQAAGANGTTYVPTGTYKITGQIELNGGDHVRWPARLVGAGSKLSVLHITSAAVGTQTDGTIRAARGVEISDMKFIYDQPDVASYGTFNQYKPVVFVAQTFCAGFADPINRGARFIRLRIEKPWDGIVVNGNLTAPGFGQDVFEDIEISALHHSIELDGLTDSTYITRLRVWPYGMTTNQANAFYLSGHAVGLWLGRAGDLRVTNSIFLVGTGVDMHVSANGPGAGTWGHFVNCQFDTYGFVKAGDGTNQIGAAIFTGCLFGSGSVVPSLPAITQNNLDVFCTGCVFYWNAAAMATTGPCILTHTGALPHSVALDNCMFYMQANNSSAIVSDETLSVQGCWFSRSSNFNYTQATILVIGGQATIIGNYSQPAGTGSGVFLNLVNSDPYPIVAGNTALGWSILWPAASAQARGFGNQTTGGTGQNQSLSVKQLMLEGGTSNNLKLLSGAGSPAGVITADPGSLYLSSSGAVYVKQTGTGNTGWSTALS